MHFANICFHNHRLKRILSGRCSRVGCLPAARAGALGAAAPSSGDAGMEPGSAAASRPAPARLCYSDSKRIRGDTAVPEEGKETLGQFNSNQTSLHCLLKLLRSLIQQWRPRCYWLLTDPKFMFTCTPASESLRSSFI